jgi:DNA-binding CsgD family transcriptional regulator
MGLPKRINSAALWEIQIANLVAKGMTNTEIGIELWISQDSVKQALKRMFRKLSVSARTEMVAKLGIIVVN